MSQNSIRNYSIFEIDTENAEATYANFDGADTQDFEDFLKRLARDTRISESTRTAVFKDESRIKEYINEYLGEADNSENNTTESAMKIAKRLFDSEKENGGKGAAKIKKGSLVVCSIDFLDKNHILIFKIDFEKYFNRKTFTKELGLPEDKGLLKSCIVDVEADGSLSDPILFDSNSTISKFWRYNFLEAEFVRDDFENTQRAYGSLTASIIGLSRSSKEDYAALKNNIITYFTTAEYYDHEKMLDAVIRHYEPFSEKVNKEAIISGFNEIKDKSKFDGNFTIDKSSIKDKIRKVFSFEDGVDLIAKAGTQTLYRTKYDGHQYVLIKTKNPPSEFIKIDLE